jgi:RNA-directed DNA polymerase
VVRDRVVQTALRNVIEPIFERDFAEHSYGFRPRRGAKDALRRVEELLKGAHHWVVDADIKGYFDSIPHSKLMAKVAKKISDGRILELIESYLKAGVMEQSKGWEATEQGPPKEE